MSQEPPPDQVTPDPKTQGQGTEEAAASKVQRLTEKAREASDRARVVADDVARRSQEARKRSRTVDTAFRAHDRDRVTAGGLMAGALAFRVFLLLLPMVLVFVAGLGIFSKYGEMSEESAQQLGLTAYAADVVDQARAQSSTGVFVALVVGLAGMFFAARSAYKALLVVHAIAWRQPIPRARGGWKPAVIVMASSIGLWLVTSMVAALKHSSLIGFIGGVLLSTCIYLGLSMLLSNVMPHAEGASWREFIPGGLVLAVGMQGMQIFSEVYLINKAQSFSELYGGLGVAAVMLLWFYLIGRLVVGSAVVNATMWDRAERAAVDPPG